MTQPPRTKVFIVEDSEIDVFLIRTALEESGLLFDAEVVNDGEMALARLDQLALPAERKPHGFIVDLNLGAHSGFDILRRIRQSEAFARAPVVIFTSSRSPSDERQAKALGADAYLEKPMELDSFLQMGKQIAAILTSR